MLYRKINTLLKPSKMFGQVLAGVLKCFSLRTTVCNLTMQCITNNYFMHLN
jgi:hypothetical protein